MQVLAEAGPASVNPGGSSLDRALERAVPAMESATSPAKIVLLYSDGEELQGDSEGKLLTIQKTLAEAGIALIVVGCGSPEGSFIQKADGSFIMFENKRVLSRLNSGLLRALGGQQAYFDLSSDSLRKRQAYLNSLQTGQAAMQLHGNREVYSWPLLAALVLFGLFLGLSDRAKTFSAALALGLFILPLQAAAPGREALQKDLEKASGRERQRLLFKLAKLYQETGEQGAAEKHFDDLLALNPDIKLRVAALHACCRKKLP